MQFTYDEYGKLLYIIEDEPVMYQTLPAYPPQDPPDFGATQPEVRNQDLNLNAYGQVGDESTQVGTDTAVDDAYDNGKECCGKTAAAGVNGLIADAKRSRGYVKDEVRLTRLVRSSQRRESHSASGWLITPA